MSDIEVDEPEQIPQMSECQVLSKYEKQVFNFIVKNLVKNEHLSHYDAWKQVSNNWEVTEYKKHHTVKYLADKYEKLNHQLEIVALSLNTLNE